MRLSTEDRLFSTAVIDLRAAVTRLLVALSSDEARREVMGELISGLNWAVRAQRRLAVTRFPIACCSAKMDWVHA